MREKYLLNALPTKFIDLAKDVIEKQIDRLCDNGNTTDKALAKTVYKDDIAILQSLLDEMNNPNQMLTGDLYVLSENLNGTQSTLQNFGKAMPTGESVKWVFLAQDWDKACAIKNRLMGFEPYKPMPTNIAINEHYVLKKNKERYALEVHIYQPQNFGDSWQCDYQMACDLPTFKPIYETVHHKNGLNVLKQAIKSVENELSQFKKLGFEILVNQMVNCNDNTK